MRAFVSEKLSLDLKHLELCVIESRIQLNASNRFYELHFFKNAPYILSYYSCNENTMRGAAKSLATPPAAFTVNMIKVIEVIDVSIP